jgi:hypothetical protein
MNLDYTMPHYQEMALALLSGAGAAGASPREPRDCMLMS